MATRHPLLFYVNFGATVAVSLLCGIAFWQLDRGDFDTVLSRIGLAFFLCLYFTLTALVSLGMWQHERMLYFHEHGAGAYGPAAFLASKAIFELLPLRVLPSLLCAAIVYPMAGLRADDAHGAAATYAAAFGGDARDPLASARVHGGAHFGDGVLRLRAPPPPTDVHVYNTPYPRTAAGVWQHEPAAGTAPLSPQRNP